MRYGPVSLTCVAALLAATPTLAAAPPRTPAAKLALQKAAKAKAARARAAATAEPKLCGVYFLYRCG
jgi:hypothetical protein